MIKTRTILIVLAGLLFAVWPIPHTATLRDSLLVLTLLTSMIYFCRAPTVTPWPRHIYVASYLLIGFMAWMLFDAIVISQETAWSLSEIGGQWSRAILALVAGFLTVASLGEPKWTERAFYVIGIPLVIHIVAVDASALMQIVTTGNTNERVFGLTEQIDKASYLSNMLLAILLAEIYSRVAGGKPVLPGGPKLLGGLFVVALYSIFAERARNGIAVIAIMILFGAVLWLVEFRHRQMDRSKRVLLISAVIVSVIGVLFLGLLAKPDNSLRRTLATVPVALDTASHYGWLNESKYGLPKLPDGSVVDLSAYLRVAWFKEGLVLATEHPWGVGYGRNAFGHAIEAKYGERKGHSHSGFIDLLVGTGIPGVLLWFAFVVSIAWFGLGQYRKTGVTYGLALFFLVVDFNARMFIDSNARDHMLQMFMFAAALLAALALYSSGSLGSSGHRRGADRTGSL